MGVKMKILVTGSEGFVGKGTVEELKKRGHEVFGYDLMLGYDIRDHAQLLEVCQQWKPDRILHLAAIARFADCDNDPVLANETNIGGTINVVSVARKLHIPIVHASTGSCYMPINLEPPILETFPIKGNSVYGCTKSIAELYVAKHNPHIILRYGHLYGKEKRYHGLIGGFLARIERGMAPTLYGGKQSNDFLYIKDVVQANVKALEAPWDKWNQAYNIGSGEELTAEEAGKIVCEVAGYDGEIEVKEAREVDAARFFYDITKAKSMLGFNPEYTFRKGLEDMFNE